MVHVHVSNQAVRKVADAFNISMGDARKLIESMFQNGTSLFTAAQNEGVDLAKIDVGDFTRLLGDVPDSMQPQFLQDIDQLPALVRDAVIESFAARPDANAPVHRGQGDPAQPTSTSNASGTTSQGTSSTPANPSGGTPATNPAGNAPPGLNNAQARNEAGPIEQILRMFIPGTGETRHADTAQSNMLQRLFGNEAFGRGDASQNINSPAMARATGTADAVHNPNAVIHARTDGNNGAPFFAGAQGREANASMQQPLIQGRADGNTSFAASTVPHASNPLGAQQAAPQQASAFAGQQFAAQAQAADRALTDSPLPQHLRGGESGIAAYRTPDAAPPPPGLDRTLANQQQLLAQQQQHPAAAQQARPDAAAAQVATHLAGATVLANPQAHTVAMQLNQNALPTPSGADNAAAAARDALLAPAGHTLAGFLRRDHRGGGQSGLQRRPADWLLALMPGARKARAQGEAEPVSFQWLFWVLTVVAYGALAAAVVIMIPNRGQLVGIDGTPTFGAYALGVGAITAIASWLLARKLPRS